MMKIRCSVCEAAEATVICTADDAALCGACDHRVHAANKLAGKHQRVPLSASPTQMPKCDICQETVGYFFCLEDRALLCRKCDIAIHTVNSLVSLHQRFLLTGVKVSEGEALISPKEKTSKSELNPSNAQHCKSIAVQDRVESKIEFSRGSCTAAISSWQEDDFIRLGDLSQNFDFIGNASFKADVPNFGDSGCSQIARASEGDELMGRVADTSWAVPQISSPPATLGLYWPKKDQNSSDSNAFVPEISSSDALDSLCGARSKRSRRF